MVPSDLPLLIIMDSSHVRSVAIKFRNEYNNIPQQERLRHILPSLGTSMGNRLATNITDTTIDNRYKICRENIIILSDYMKFLTNDSGKRNESYYWPSSYWDKHPNRCLMEINSHQLNNEGTMRNPTIPLSPSHFFISGNHVVDTMCSISMGTYGSNQLSLITVPPIRYPPHVNDFGFTYNACWLDGDTTTTIYDAFYKELRIRNSDRAQQGYISRYHDLLDYDFKVIKMVGELRNIIFDTGISHIRCTRCDDKYLKAYYYHLYKGILKRRRLKENCGKISLMREDPNIASCPLCNLGEKGNQRHLHTVCSHPHLIKVRMYLHHILEKELKKTTK